MASLNGIGSCRRLNSPYPITPGTVHPQQRLERYSTDKQTISISWMVTPVSAFDRCLPLGKAGAVTRSGRRRLRLDQRRAADMVRYCLRRWLSFLETPEGERDPGRPKRRARLSLPRLLPMRRNGSRWGLTSIALTIRAMLRRVNELTEGGSRLLAEWLDRIVQSARSGVDSVGIALKQTGVFRPRAVLARGDNPAFPGLRAGCCGLPTVHYIRRAWLS